MSRGEFEETSAGKLRYTGKRRQLATDTKGVIDSCLGHPYSDLKPSPEHQGTSTLQKHRHTEQEFQPVMGAHWGATGNGLI